MVVALKSGTVLRGRIEWIDTYALKVERKPAAPNVLVYKTAIAYIHRAEQSKNDGENS
jgi:sRNA-binding regulator protein Hfq